MRNMIESGFKYFFPELGEKPEDAAIFYKQKELRSISAEDVATIAAEDDWYADPAEEPCKEISVIAPDGSITIWEIRYEDTRNFYAEEVTP